MFAAYTFTSPLHLHSDLLSICAVPDALPQTTGLNSNRAELPLTASGYMENAQPPGRGDCKRKAADSPPSESSPVA